MPPKICRVPGCGRKRQAKGLCQSHRKRQIQGKPVDVPIRRRLQKRESDTCIFPGCGRKHHCKGLCAVHDKQRKAGNELTPIKGTRRAPAPAPTGMKFCPECSTFLPVSEFRSNRSRKSNLLQVTTYCATCIGHRQIATKLGVPIEEARSLRNVDTCEICERVYPGFSGLTVDHDHSTGEVRGVLCRSDNSLLGFAGDLPEIMENAARYIEKNAGLLRFHPPKLPRRKERIELRGLLNPDEKWCAQCEQVLPRSTFQNGLCLDCARLKSAARAHDTTIEHIKDLRSRKRCEICLTTEPGGKGQAFHIDHDHRSGVIRGVLCNNCNLMIGHAQDDPSRLRAAANYIRRYGVDYITRYAASRRAA